MLDKEEANNSPTMVGSGWETKKGVVITIDHFVPESDGAPVLDCRGLRWALLTHSGTIMLPAQQEPDTIQLDDDQSNYEAKPHQQRKTTSASAEFQQPKSTSLHNTSRPRPIANGSSFPLFFPKRKA